MTSKPPAFLGKLVYFFGYPIFRLLIKNTNRAYVLVTYEDQIILTKNWLGFQKKWRLPGGGINNGEEPINAVVRELAEELNISASPESLNCITPQPINDKLNYKYWLFEYRTDKEQKFSPDEKEILVAKYFDRNNLKNINLSDEALRALNLTI